MAENSDLFSKLPEALVTRIFELAGVNPVTLANCCVISKKYGRIVRGANVGYVPIIRLSLRVREDAGRVLLREDMLRPPPPTSGPHESSEAVIRKFKMAFLTAPKTDLPAPPPPPPPPPPPRFMLSFPATLRTILQSFITPGVLTQFPTPATFEVAISFPDRPVSPDRGGVLVKWRGVFTSLTNFSFAFAFADDVHPTDLHPVPNVGRTESSKWAYYHLKNFIRMAELVKNGAAWFNSLDTIVISYSRRMSRAFMEDESDFPDFTAEDFYFLQNRVRAWPVESLTNIHGMDFLGFSVAIIIGRDINANNYQDLVFDDDQMLYDDLINAAFADDLMLYDAITQSIASVTHPQSSSVRDLKHGPW